MEPDVWELRGDYLVRKHNNPRVELFIPDASCPLKHEWLDLYRITKTSLPAEEEIQIQDIWRPDKVQPSLSAPWVGETIFEIRRPRAEPGFEWQHGRKTKLQRTNRPPSVWPEVWRHLNAEARGREIKKWQAESVARSEAREARKLGSENHIPDKDLPHYRKALQS